jgi:heme-degrading monooxygenase HmoA
MFTRVVSFTGARDIDAGVAFTQDTVAPLMREQKGFRGTTASADRSGGVFAVLSLWETEADRDASESALAKVREEAQTVIGGEPGVENFEVFVNEAVGPPVVGAQLLIRRISMDPAKVDDNLAFFKREVLPVIKGSPGFRAVRNMINRRTGEGIVGTVWADSAALEAAAATAEERRQQATNLQVSFGEQSRREIVFVDLP